MDYDILQSASRRLAELDIELDIAGCKVIVNWFRVMIKDGNWRIPRHSHSSYEFHFIKEGDCTVQTDTDVFHVGQGSFYLTPPNTHHSQSNGDCERCIEYSLDVEFRHDCDPQQGEMSLIDAFLSSSPCRPCQDSHGIIPLFDRALKEAYGRMPGYSVIVTSLVPEILALAARSLGYGAPQNGGHSRDSIQKSRMELIAGFVHDNIHDPISPADIASFMNLSEKQVSRIVLASEGISTKKFIIFSKIEEAKRLLLSTDNSISKISGDLSFSSTSYFVNVFTRHAGISPGGFRSHKKQQV